MKGYDNGISHNMIFINFVILVLKLYIRSKKKKKKSVMDTLVLAFAEFWHETQSRLFFLSSVSVLCRSS